MAARVGRVADFDPEVLTGLDTIFLIAPTASGKTTTLYALLHAIRHKVLTGMGFSASEKDNRALEFCLPSTLIYDTFEDEKIEHALATGSAVKAECESDSIVVVMDDILNEDAKGRGRNKVAALKSNSVSKLVRMGRHSGLALLLCAHNASAIPTDVSTNARYVVAFSTTPREVDALHERFFSAAVPSRREFHDLFAECTKAKGQSLIIDTKASDPDAMLFTFRPPLRGWDISPPFMVGDPSFFTVARAIEAPRVTPVLDPVAITGRSARALGCVTEAATSRPSFTMSRR